MPKNKYLVQLDHESGGGGARGGQGVVRFALAQALVDVVYRVFAGDEAVEIGLDQRLQLPRLLFQVTSHCYAPALQLWQRRLLQRSRSWIQIPCGKLRS